MPIPNGHQYVSEGGKAETSDLETATKLLRLARPGIGIAGACCRGDCDGSEPVTQHQNYNNHVLQIDRWVYRKTISIESSDSFASLPSP